MAQEFPFIGPAYSNASLPTNAQELVNMHLKTGGPGGRDHVRRTAGLELNATGGILPVHELFELNGNLFAIAGTTLYSVIDGSASSIGSISGSQRPEVSKYVNDSGNEEAIIVRGSRGYIFDGSTATQITDIDFPTTANSVTSINNVQVIAGEENKFYASDVGDGSSYDPTWFERVTDIGSIVAVLADHDELFVFGDEGVQIYDYSANGTALPFFKRLGSKIEMGCVSRTSIAQMDNSFVYLGKSPTGTARVWRIQGYQPLNITSPAIEEEMAGYAVVDDAIGFSYYQGGHEFYVLTFPSEGKTWVYDAAVGDPKLAWHRRESYRKDRWRANCHQAIGTTHYIGDFENGNIYKMKLDVYDDNGDPMIAKRVAPHYPAGFYHYLKLGIESGVGLVSGQGSSPEVMIRYSDDWGRTYSPEKRRNFGARGEFDTLVEVHGMGLTRNARTFEVSCSDPVPFTLYMAELGFTPYGK